MITYNCLCPKDPLCGNYRYLHLNLDDWQIPKIVVLGAKIAFSPNFIIIIIIIIIIG